jgi:sugar lactone lactonase YvrE
MNLTRRPAAAIAAVVTATAGLLAGSGILAGAANAATPFIGPLNTVTVVASATPANGDQNPYGVAVVKESTGNLHEGNVLVSNFNDITNTQGTGTTIVQVTPHGAVSVFAQIDRNLAGCPGGVGLTTALVALRNGWVIVGSLPTQNGGAISGSGCLIVLDSHGVVRKTFSGHGINGPWDMTALDLGGVSELFVTNVLNDTVAGKGAVVHEGTVLRLIITSGPFERPRLLAVTQIGSGFAEKTDPTALVIGPTGVGLGRNGTLYVADSVNSRIAAIPNAIFRFSDDGAGRTVTQGGFLMGELGLAIAPNGDILTVNAGDGNMVETTPGGTQVTFKTVDSQGNPPGAGNLFGLAVKPGADAVYFVDDFGGPSATNNTNSLDLLSAP